jgi:tetratricopeptide (TPR) repeat protein
MGRKLHAGWLLTALLFYPLVTPAQTPKSNSVVSVRELSIPVNAQRDFDKGVELLAKKDPADCFPSFQRAISEFAGYYEAYYQMGVADLKLWRIADGEQAFRKANELSGEQYAPSLLGLGAVLGYQQKFAEAEKVIRQGLALDPDSWSGHYYLGWALFGLNRLEDAEKSVREAIRLKNDSTVALQLLADIHSRQQNYRALVTDLDAYLKLDSTSPTGIRARALRDTAQRLVRESENTTALALH